MKYNNFLEVGKGRVVDYSVTYEEGFLVREIGPIPSLIKQLRKASPEFILRSQCCKDSISTQYQAIKFNLHNLVGA